MVNGSWELLLLAALLGVAALLIVGLFVIHQFRSFRPTPDLELEREFATMLRAVADRRFSPAEIRRLARLGRRDRIALFRAWLRLWPELYSPVPERARSALRRSRILDQVLADLHHRRAARRADACRILGRLGFISSTPELIRRLEDSNASVRQRAVAALCDLRAAEAMDAIAASLDAHDSWGDLIAIMALSRMGPAAVSPVGTLLDRSASPARIKGLLQVTGQLGVAADPAAVRSLASHEDAEVRVEAVRALGRIPPEPASVDVCLAALDDEAWPTRALAARSLGRLGDERAIPRLERAMGDPGYWVRHHAGEALAELGAAGVRALERRLDDANLFVRDMAAQKLFTSAAAQGSPI